MRSVNSRCTRSIWGVLMACTRAKINSSPHTATYLRSVQRSYSGTIQILACAFRRVRLTPCPESLLQSETRAARQWTKASLEYSRSHLQTVPHLSEILVSQRCGKNAASTLICTLILESDQSLLGQFAKVTLERFRAGLR